MEPEDDVLLLFEVIAFCDLVAIAVPPDAIAVSFDFFRDLESVLADLAFLTFSSKVSAFSASLQQKE